MNLNLQTLTLEEQRSKMAIKRFFSNADNTITDAFKASLTTRGTGSNAGQSDILEVFSIFGQGASGSLERSRALINFNVSNIKSARDANTIPASGSVKFFLRVFNAEHGQTLPRDCKLAILPVSRSWDEGSGMDMEEYSDEDSCNWIFASNTKVADITDITFVSTNLSAYENRYFVLQVLDDNVTQDRYNFWFDHNGTGSAPSLLGEEVEVQLDQAGPANVRKFAKQVKTAVDALGVNLSASISEDDTGDSTNATVRLTNTVVGGTSGSIIPESVRSNSTFTMTKVQIGGKTRWTNEGGDFHEVGYSVSPFGYGKNLPHYAVDLDRGTEDIELNITALVEEWIEAESTVDPDRESYGVMIKLSGSFEDGTLNRSYYTKKFFARGTEFFFKRPCIEARWDSSIRDDRANFFKSSSLATGPENLNTLYMYNYTRRGLSNIPALKTDPNGADQTTGEALMRVRLYPDLKSSSKAIVLPVGGGVSDGRAKAVITVAGNPGNAESFTMTDSADASVTFTFQQGNNSVAASSATTSTVGIFSVLGSNTGIAERIQQSIANSSLAVTAVDNGDGTVTVTQNAIGTAGNKALNMASVANVSVPNNTFAHGHAQDFAECYLHETGIYSASLATTGSHTKVFDVWSHTDSSHNGGKHELFTGSAITVKTHTPLPYSNADEEYVASLPNLKPLYRRTDSPTLRFSFKNPSNHPNIYNVVTNKTETEVLYNVYYRVYRIVDEQDVISFGSGSLPYTKMSYDSSGSFFKLDMSLFESGYMYGIEVATDEFGRNITNKDVFKFRVE